VSALRAAGAQLVYGAATHPLLSGNAYARINESDVEKLLVCDTIPLKEESPKIEVMTVAGIFAEAIERTFENKSISSLFDIEKS
jgi:ribose-phosphate pyrophosphokinase